MKKPPHIKMDAAVRAKVEKLFEPSTALGAVTD